MLTSSSKRFRSVHNVNSPEQIPRFLRGKRVNAFKRSAKLPWTWKVCYGLYTAQHEVIASKLHNITGSESMWPGLEYQFQHLVKVYGVGTNLSSASFEILCDHAGPKTNGKHECFFDFGEMLWAWADVSPFYAVLLVQHTTATTLECRLE